MSWSVSLKTFLLIQLQVTTRNQGEDKAQTGTLYNTLLTKGLLCKAYVFFKCYKSEKDNTKKQARGTIGMSQNIDSNVLHVDEKMLNLEPGI
jgi:hypothetical protein